MKKNNDISKKFIIIRLAAGLSAFTCFTRSRFCNAVRGLIPIASTGKQNRVAAYKQGNAAIPARSLRSALVNEATKPPAKHIFSANKKHKKIITCI